jgi:pimeloyl-ACP methyl ester carboxylesterase
VLNSNTTGRLGSRLDADASNVKPILPGQILSCGEFMEGIAGQELPIEIKEIAANGMTFRCRVCGMENSGEPVILMHGFPETSHMWEKMLVLLATQGYRCLAPDLRGYSSGARPQDVASYSIDKIASDIIALADAVGFEKFQLIGHDWGAGCGWTIVQLYPDRVNSWSALSIPHMAAFNQAKKTDKEQKSKSWYMTLFQLPLIPEQLFGTIVAVSPAKFWNHSSPAEVADYVAVFKEFAGRKAIINWYRANKELPIVYGDVTIPTILIWGNQDIAVAKAGVDMTEKYLKGEHQIIELNAGHTLIQEEFEKVSQEILNHIQGHPIALLDNQ